MGSLFDGGFLRVAMTDRRRCARPLPEQVARVAGAYDALIMREKDLDDGAYAALAREVMEACERAGVAFVAHGHVPAAREAGASRLHLPLPALERDGRPEGFDLVGTNVHEVDEVAVCRGTRRRLPCGEPRLCAVMQAAPGPRGVAFLEQVIAAAHVPVLALGGITDATEHAVRAAGAAGAVRMSDAMA